MLYRKISKAREKRKVAMKRPLAKISNNKTNTPFSRKSTSGVVLEWAQKLIKQNGTRPPRVYIWTQVRMANFAPCFDFGLRSFWTCKTSQCLRGVHPGADRVIHLQLPSNQKYCFRLQTFFAGGIIFCLASVDKSSVPKGALKPIGAYCGEDGRCVWACVVSIATSKAQYLGKLLGGLGRNDQYLCGLTD